RRVDELSRIAVWILWLENRRIPSSIFLCQPGRRHPKLRAHFPQPSLMPPGQPKQLALIMPRHTPKGSPVKQVIVHKKHHPLRWMAFQYGFPSRRHIAHEHNGCAHQICWLGYVRESMKPHILSTPAEKRTDKEVCGGVLILVNDVY